MHFTFHASYLDGIIFRLNALKEMNITNYDELCCFQIWYTMKKSYDEKKTIKKNVFMVSHNFFGIIMIINRSEIQFAKRYNFLKKNDLFLTIS